MADMQRPFNINRNRETPAKKRIISPVETTLPLESEVITQNITEEPVPNFAQSKRAPKALDKSRPKTIRSIPDSLSAIRNENIAEEVSQVIENGTQNLPENFGQGNIGRQNSSRRQIGSTRRIQTAKETSSSIYNNARTLEAEQEALEGVLELKKNANRKTTVGDHVGVAKGNYAGSFVETVPTTPKAIPLQDGGAHAGQAGSLEAWINKQKQALREYQPVDTTETIVTRTPDSVEPKPILSEKCQKTMNNIKKQKAESAEQKVLKRRVFKSEKDFSKKMSKMGLVGTGVAAIAATAGIYSALNGSRGQQSNAQLYGQQPLY